MEASLLPCSLPPPGMWGEGVGRRRAPLQRHSPQSRDPKRVQILQESPHVILAAGAVQVLQEGSRWAPGKV